MQNAQEDDVRGHMDELRRSLERTERYVRANMAKNLVLTSEWHRNFKVEREEYNGIEWVIKKFKVDGFSIAKMRAFVAGRDVPDGVYTALYRRSIKLYEDGRDVEALSTVMSDTPAEIEDHAQAYYMVAGLAEEFGAARVLINGLGLGVFLDMVRSVKEVKHIDVVEQSFELIDAMSPYFAHDKRVHIHQGDALTFQFPPKTSWDIVWHDIWPTISLNNLPSMHRLHRRYGQKSQWQGSWQREFLKEHERNLRRWRRV